MSTSTLGRAERQPLLDAFVMQRRILFGCVGLLGIGIVLWSIAMASDYWLTVKPDELMFVRDSRRYFKSSNLGLWRECRTTIIPHPLLNSTNARNFTAIAYTNRERINEVKEGIIKDKPTLIYEFLKKPLNESTEVIDENFRRHLYISWLTNNATRFSELKSKYKKILAQNGTHNPEYLAKNIKEMLLNPVEMETVKVLIGQGLKQTEISGHKINAIVPLQLQHALYFGWDKNAQNYYLLYGFAKDMDISYLMTIENGTKYYLIKPPPPPPKGGVAHGYDYNEFSRCANHDMFPDDDESSPDHSSLDAEIVHYTRTEASFACMTLLVMIMGFFFSMYTFMNPRYMFKRLAGGINFIAMSTSIVVIQVLAHSRALLALKIPVEDIYYRYGYAFYMAYFVFTFNLISGLMFMWFSKKKKGEKAPTEEIGMADEPTIIGR